MLPLHKENSSNKVQNVGPWNTALQSFYVILGLRFHTETPAIEESNVSLASVALFYLRQKTGCQVHILSNDGIKYCKKPV